MRKYRFFLSFVIIILFLPLSIVAATENHKTLETTTIGINKPTPGLPKSQTQPDLFDDIVKKGVVGDIKGVQEILVKLSTINKFDSTTLGLMKIIDQVNQGSLDKSYVISIFKGLNNLKDKKIELAIEEFANAKKISSDFAMPYTFLTICYLANGQNEQAILACKNAIKIEPNNSQIYIVLGSIYRSLNNFSDSRVALHKAKQIALNNMNKSEAEEIITLISSIDLDENYYYYVTGTIAASHGKFKTAKQAFENACAIDRMDFESLNSLRNINDYMNKKISREYTTQLFVGLNLLRKGVYLDAIRELKKAIEIDPSYARAYSSTGTGYYKSNQINDAIFYYKKSIDVNQNYFMPYYNLGIIYANLDKSNEAISCYEKAVKLYPDYIPAYNNLGAVYRHKKQFPKSIAYYMKAASFNKPFYNSPYLGLGNVYLDMGKNEDALACYLKANKIAPFDANSYNSIGLALLEMKKFNEAIPFLLRAIMIDPKAEYAYYRLGNAYREMNDLDKANQCYNIAIEHMPEYAPAYHNRANVESRLGQYDKMLISLDKARKLYKSQGDLDQVADIDKYMSEPTVKQFKNTMDLMKAISDSLLKQQEAAKRQINLHQVELEAGQAGKHNNLNKNNNSSR